LLASLLKFENEEAQLHIQQINLHYAPFLRPIRGANSAVAVTVSVRTPRKELKLHIAGKKYRNTFRANELLSLAPNSFKTKFVTSMGIVDNGYQINFGRFATVKDRNRQ
jgi:hypothetical protein